MIQKSSVIGMGMLFVIALLMIISLSNTPGNKITGMFALGPDTLLEEINSTYSLAPLFKVDVDYSLEEYDPVESMARELLHQCRGSDPDIVNVCVKNEIATMHGWTLVENQDLMYKFDVEGKKEIPLYDESAKKLEKRLVTYKFALDFSE